jgi:2-polyprenyl-3-methyl-5-hydroxy-6-metoxy-1,4-benzoquinol methylase
MTGIPPCPVTGQAGSRLIQRIPSNLLIGLWRASFRVETGAQLVPGREFGLWESPCGLIFFDPLIAGDRDFYRNLYPAWTRNGPWSAAAAPRADYSQAAALIGSGQRVLDVGCGAGAFAACVPGARFIGLDDNYPVTGTAVDIRNESLASHMAAHAGTYDAVSAFHVLEHAADPAKFVHDMQRCLKPGGLLFISVPKYRSAINDIPNFVFNAPPHHLTWWNERALRALALTSGLHVQSVAGLPMGAHHRLGHWMGRAAPKLTGDIYFKSSRQWHGALAWSFIAGFAMSAVLGTPRHAPPIELLLIARKPAAA